MKLDPPMLVEGCLSRKVFVVTHGKVHEPYPGDGEAPIVEASVKYDVTEQFEALAARRKANTDA